MSDIEPIRPLNAPRIDNTTLIMGVSIAIAMIGLGLYAIYYGYEALMQANLATAALGFMVGIILIGIITLSFIRQTKKS
jgi:hypothetical protein